MWKVSNGNKVYLGIVVRALGWLGFGLAENNSGGMGGSDIVVFESSDPSRVLDLYAVGESQPLEDNCHHWKLGAYEQNSTHTFVEVSRKLDTNDLQDRPIIEGPMRVIVAYGSSDTMSFHDSSEIGVVEFIPSQSDNQQQNLATMMKTNQVFSLITNVTIPTRKTSYMCKVIELPADKDYHIVHIRTIATTESLKYLHHIAMHRCYYNNNPSNYIKRYMKPSANHCYSGLGNHETGCSETIHIWSKGQSLDLSYPPEAGFRVGTGPYDLHYILIEVHYNNPGLDKGIFDESGFQIFYTDQLREYDLGTMALGDPYASGDTIPADSESFAVEIECPSRCTSRWPHPIHVIYNHFHMHKAGITIYDTLYRNQTKLGSMNRIEYWNTDMQELTPVNYTIYPGDSIHTFCIYNTKDHPSISFGSGIDSEMCLEYITYYPRLYTTDTDNYAVCGRKLAKTSKTKIKNIDPNSLLTVCGDTDYAYKTEWKNGEYHLNPETPMFDHKDAIRIFGQGNLEC
eukprot:TRINITY_DN1906_c0_g1_i2.p1 TRINITY_DN1906_c0_g1~~TRINITY_DN1906_c0_g1_i2.p1  ORF type:complete len:513 (+),score=70.73 TRINITY_DN1906_c0_g1_i2:208-1746(+)